MLVTYLDASRPWGLGSPPLSVSIVDPASAPRRVCWRVLTYAGVC
jgi:hypothetical protein